MRTFLPLLFIFSPIAIAMDYPDCDIKKEKEVSFRGLQAKDKIIVTVKGKPCFEATFILEVVTDSGVPIYAYESEFKVHTSVSWKDPELDKTAEEFVERIIQGAIGNSSDLPASFQCELPSHGCEPYEKNAIPLDQYLKIRNDAIPVLNHPTYYEGWASFFYDVEAMKVVKVYEGGV